MGNRDNKKLYKLYNMYLQELIDNYNIDIEDKTAEEVVDSFQDLFHDIVKIHDESGEEIGFLIVGEFPDCHPDCDKYICQAYVLPEHRRKGLMSKAVLDYMQEHPGAYCLDILKGNEIAEAFWEHVFAAAEYESTEMRYVEHNVKNCNTYYYQPKQEENTSEESVSEFDEISKTLNKIEDLVETIDPEILLEYLRKNEWRDIHSMRSEYAILQNNKGNARIIQVNIPLSRDNPKYHQMMYRAIATLAEFAEGAS